MSPEMVPPPEPLQAIFGAILGVGSAIASSGIGRRIGGAVLGRAASLVSTPARRVGISAGAGVVAGDAISLASGARTPVVAPPAPIVPIAATPPVYSPQGTGGLGSQPVAGVPSSSSGRAMLAANGQLALTLPVTYQAVARPPRGYVTVMYNGEKLFMLKGCARDLGLWRPRMKPPISVKNWNALKRARSAQRQVERASATAERITGCSTRSSSRSSARKSGGRRRRKDGRFA